MAHGAGYNTRKGASHKQAKGMNPNYGGHGASTHMAGTYNPHYEMDSAIPSMEVRRFSGSSITVVGGGITNVKSSGSGDGVGGTPRQSNTGTAWR